MTVLEMMERAGMKNTTLAVAFIKDAIHLMQSQVDVHTATWKTNITDGTREYPFPANMIRLNNISIKDTNDSKYKRIRRLSHKPLVSEDTDPE
jgi:spermidine/putrescine-binding protein